MIQTLVQSFHFSPLSFTAWLHSGGIIFGDGLNGVASDFFSSSCSLYPLYDEFPLFHTVVL